MHFCFAKFSRYYYLPSNPKYKENDYQPEELDDDIVEDTSNSDYLYIPRIFICILQFLSCIDVLFYFTP